MCLCVGMHTCEGKCHRIQKRVLTPLQLELPPVVSHPVWVLGMELGSFVTASKAELRPARSLSLVRATKSSRGLNLANPHHEQIPYLQHHLFTQCVTSELILLCWLVVISAQARVMWGTSVGELPPSDCLWACLQDFFLN